MTHGDFLYLLYDRSKQFVPQEFREWATIGIFANLGYKFVYPLGLRQMRYFYQKSQAFTATSNSVNLPTDCQRLLGVQIPGVLTNAPLTGRARCYQGGAVPMDIREYATIISSSVQAPAAQNPKYREDSNSGVIMLFPYQDADGNNFAGELHYLRNFGQITDPTFELSMWGDTDDLPIFPAIYEEDAMMEALRQMRMRTKSILDEPSSIEEMLTQEADTMKALEAGLDPLMLYRETVPAPLPRKENT